jgi:hypothetical protein
MRRAAAALTACALVATGCGAGHKPRPEATKPSALARAEATHEYPSPAPPRQVATAPVASPADAIRAFATAYINWDAQTVARDMRALATRSIGQARSAMALAAAETASDYELQRGGIANHGTVEAVSPLPGKPHQYVVVSLESTSATNTSAYQGLRAAWHVALATVTEQRTGQWVLSAWQPEN